MFSKQDRILFFLSGALVGLGLLLMATDVAPNGFGIATLWIAPPLLLTGFVLPVMALTGMRIFSLSYRLQEIPKHVGGLLAFAVALVVYLHTLEPTASLWDCSEFISSAYKLQVPHTPGTPLSLLIGRLFTMLSFGDVTKVAWTLNFMSAFFSALTVCLLYHIIVYLGHMLLHHRPETKWVLVAGAFGGSLCLAFSDTFWFSAVEAETYGPACFFLLLLVWLIITGPDLVGPARSRRLILIFYIAGLAYCVHPMCLLAIPILPFTWTRSPGKTKLKKTIFLVAGGSMIVLFINRFIAIGYFELAFTFDRILVNGFGLPFYSGAIALIGVSTGACWFLLTRFPRVSHYTWSFVFLLFGFVPYLILFIRSNHNPPIDETNPENLAMIKAYMNRESYPSSPLLYGPYFDAKVIDVGVQKKAYYKDKECYRTAGSIPEYLYDSRQTVFPRMYSNDENHIASYRSWTGLRKNEKPRFFHNLDFMFSYQLGHMYFRYLMWNFAGREGDVQNSDWLKPWEAFDNTAHQRARNQYWMVPLILGFAGAFFQFRRDSQGLITVALLFLITGLILALYLNSPPNEPRERDYIYVGSFITFSIWIGLGLIFINRTLFRSRVGIAAGVMLVLAVPLWMLHQNFDDHNRSGRTFQVDNARNVLRGCAPNAILFTGGDNDTFPLWYVQEVEGFRTDVRVMVLSYMNTDWYINQLRKAYYNSPSFKLTLNEDDYRQYGPNDVLYVQETIPSAIDVGQFLRLLQKEHPGLKMIAENGETYHILPSRILKISSDKVATMTAGSPSPPSGSSQDVMLNVTSSYLSKNMLAILDLIVSNGWMRPIYFNFTSLNSLGVDLSLYVIQEGVLFRLRPSRNTRDDIAVDTSLSYRNLVEAADYSNLSDSAVYFSYEDHFLRMIVPLRHSFNDLAGAFLGEGNSKKALDVMQKALADLYPDHLPPSYTNVHAAEILLALNEKELAGSLSKHLFEYHFHHARQHKARRHNLSDLERYLLRRSAELLAMTGNKTYLEKLSGLGI